MNLRTKSSPDPATGVRWPARLLALGLMAASSTVSAAKMYHWVDPNTGSVQLAGKPPPWYRSPLPGPRVRVYEHGKVIDDTALAAPPSAPANFDSSGDSSGTVPHRDPAASEQDREHAAREIPSPATTADQVEEFKALLEAWDKAQAAQADSVAPTSAVDSTVTKPLHSHERPLHAH